MLTIAILMFVLATMVRNYHTGLELLELTVVLAHCRELYPNYQGLHYFRERAWRPRCFLQRII